jgi:hypothetical protein
MRRRQANDLRCGFVDRVAKSPLVASEGIASRGLDLALEGLFRLEHVRRPIECSSESLGFLPGQRASPRARASCIYRDPWPNPSTLRIHRPHNPTLQLTGADDRALVAPVGISY